MLFKLLICCICTYICSVEARASRAFYQRERVQRSIYVEDDIHDLDFDEPTRDEVSICSPSSSCPKLLLKQVIELRHELNEILRKQPADDSPVPAWYVLALCLTYIFAEDLRNIFLNVFRCLRLCLQVYQMRRTLTGLSSNLNQNGPRERVDPVDPTSHYTTPQGTSPMMERPERPPRAQDGNTTANHPSKEVDDEVEVRPFKEVDVDECMIDGLRTDQSPKPQPNADTDSAMSLGLD